MMTTKGKRDHRDSKIKREAIRRPLESALGVIHLLLWDHEEPLSEEKRRMLTTAKENLEGIHRRLISGRFLFLFTVILAGIASAGFSVKGEKEGKEILYPSRIVLPLGRPSFDRMKVAVLEKQEEAHLSLSGSYRLEDLLTGALLMKGRGPTSGRITADRHGFRFGDEVLRSEALRLTPLDGEIEIGNRKFAGSLEISKDKEGRFLIVNEIELEEYLKGVLPKEVLSRWPLETLKAQAVAARTFALFQRFSHPGKPFHIKGDLSSQVYGGKSVETSATSRAIEETRGAILLEEGAIFPTYFHAACGGKTINASLVWKMEPHPSLKGVLCPYCRDSKHYFWIRVVSKKELEEKIRKAGFSVGSVDGIKPGDSDSSGRCREMVIQSLGREFLISSNRFRLIVGAHEIRSFRNLTVTGYGSSWVFSGYGWGHGAGLCQWGAKKMGEEGKSYREILQFYFPKSEIGYLNRGRNAESA